jgi:restriction endonuclease S subunit
LKALPVPLASLEEQTQIVAMLDSIDARIQAERATTIQLGALKSALASALLTGAVRVTPDKDLA